MRVGKRVRFELQHELGREPLLAEIEMQVPGFTRAVVRCTNHTPLSIDAPLSHNADNTIADFPLASLLAGSTDVATIVVNHEALTELRAAICDLDERRRAVIESHYFAELPLHDVARDFGVSNQRASQLHCTAIAKLRSSLAVA